MKFAIKTIEKVSGEVFCVPVCREKGLFETWKRIDKIYDRYYLDIFDIEDEVIKLTHEQAKEFIDGYIKQYKQDNLDKIKSKSIGLLPESEYFLEKF